MDERAGQGAQCHAMSDDTAVPELADMVAMMPFASELGIELTAATPEEVTARLAWRAELCTTFGLLHGGVLMTMADSMGAVCAFLNLPVGATTSTIESKTNFFRGVREGAVHSTTRPLHVGRTTIVVQTDLHDDRARRVAQVTQTQAVIAGS
jgi:1,4-dihydroxy-2-naphthoyl-CoA hydrolase